MTDVDVAWLELWVGDARSTVSTLTDGFGFSLLGGHAGSFVLAQGTIRFVVTDASVGDAVADFVRVHGDGVRDIALAVSDPTSPGPPVPAFGDTVHTVVAHPADDLPFPASAPTGAVTSDGGPLVGLTSIDHLAISLETGTSRRWADEYATRFGFTPVGESPQHIDIGTSAFSMSTIRGGRGNALLVLAEPTPESTSSQIADYLGHFRGPGVHHIAFATDDIVRTVAALRARGVRTLPAPEGYHGAVRRRLPDLDVRWADLEDLGVLVDADADGYLLQTFTEPLGDRPTLYAEIIQRAGATGFGSDNVRALYRAVVLDNDARAGRSPV